MTAHGLPRPPEPYNERIKSYAPGSPERQELRSRLDELSAQRMELPLVIGGKDVQLSDTFEQVMPHDKEHVLAAVSDRPFNFDAFSRSNHWDYRALAPDNRTRDPEAALLDLADRMTDGQPGQLYGREPRGARVSC